MKARHLKAVLGCAVVGVCVWGGTALGAGINRIDSTPARISTNFSVGKVNGSSVVAFVSPGVNGGADRVLALPLAGGVPITIVGEGANLRMRKRPEMLYQAWDAEIDDYLFAGTDLGTGDSALYAVSAKSGGGGLPPAPIDQRPVWADAGRASRAPTASGPVVFKSIDATGGEVVVAKSSRGSVPITVIGSNFGAMSTPAISDTGDVAAIGTIPGDAGTPSSRGLLVKPAGGGILLTVRGENWRSSPGDRLIFVGGEDATMVGSVIQDTSTGARPMIIIASKKGYDAYQALAQEVQGTIAVPPPAQGTDPRFAVAALGSTSPGPGRIGQTNILARYPGGAALSRISIDSPPFDPAPGANPPPPPSGFSEIPLLQVGDPIDGSTIASIDITEGSVIDDYNYVVALTLANGNSGFYLYSVPEPVALGLVAPTVVLLRRRR